VNNKIIIITGYLASGKSTFARKLSKSLSIPCLIKDTFKIAICTNISVTSGEESSIYSSVTFDAMMYVVERHMETNTPIIIEGNFVPAGIKKTDESSFIQALIDKYNYKSLTFKFYGDTKILHTRYIERDILPERGGVNAFYKDVPHADFDTICHNLDSFCVGDKTIDIDTTDFNAVNFDKHIETAQSFINKSRQQV